MTYEAQPGIFVGRPPCVQCGAAYRLHAKGACPEAWRPNDLTEAKRSLARAESLRDSAAIFVARGEVQRLSGRGRRVRG